MGCVSLIFVYFKICVLVNTALCRSSSIREARKVFIYVSGGTDAALDVEWSPYLLMLIEWISIFWLFNF